MTGKLLNLIYGVCVLLAYPPRCWKLLLSILPFLLLLIPRFPILPLYMALRLMLKGVYFGQNCPRPL
uniref:Uncharacterized protein n=1 Tax=Glycine max TaxID=3847 RepID=K7KP08_SOYBN